MKTFTHTYFEMTPERFYRVLRTPRKSNRDPLGETILLNDLICTRIVGTPEEFNQWLCTDRPRWVYNIGQVTATIVEILGAEGEGHTLLLEFPPNTYEGHNGDGKKLRYEEGYRYWYFNFL